MRIDVIESNLAEDNLLKKMQCYKALPASKDHLLLAHDAVYIDALMEIIQGRVDSLLEVNSGDIDEQLYFDGDLDLNEYSMQAAELAAGSVIQGVDLTMTRCADNVFCAVRPPGHNAGRNFAEGGCIINNVMVGAHYAKLVYRLERIAIVDFDASFGFGTQDIVKDDDHFLYISVFQHREKEQEKFQENYNNVKRFPMMKNADGERYKTIFKDQVLPIIRDYKPQMLFISAGFNGHTADFTSDLQLVDDDYYRITQSLLAEMRATGDSKVISVLENGYNLKALTKSLNQHLRALIGLPANTYRD